MTDKVSLFDGLITGEWPKHVSSSQRTSWYGCRLRCALSTAARVKPKAQTVGSKGLIVGSLVHSVLGQHYRTPIAARSEAKLHAWLDLISDVEGHDATIVGQAKTRAHAILTRFAAKYGNDGITPSGIEVPTPRPLECGVQYVGFADMVYEDGEMIVVEDWKTSLASIEPTKHTVFNPQGRDYLWALSERYDPTRLVMSWLLMTPASVRRIQTPIGALPDVHAELNQLAIEERTLPPEPSYGGHCMWCPFRALCETKLTGGDVRTVFEQQYRVSERIIEDAEDDDDG